MSTVIQIDDRGIATLEIANPAGEVLSYTLALSPRGLDACAWQIARVDGEGSYRVALTLRGRWTCTCASWKYRRAHWCKHCESIAPLSRFITSLEINHELPHDTRSPHPADPGHRQQAAASAAITHANGTAGVA